MNDETVTMYRPTGPEELELLRRTGFTRWPPRLPEQPIFYPVLNQEYARKISSEWNLREYGAGYVTRFHLRKDFAANYPVQTVGDSTCTELWIPAEELPAFNANIVGLIEVVDRCETVQRHEQDKSPAPLL